MPLPGGLATITVTGSFTDASGTPQSGSVSFTPTSPVMDAAGKTVLTETAVTAVLSAGAFSVVLPCTDSESLTPLGWAFSVEVSVPGAQQTFTCFLPHALGATVDITQLPETPAVLNPSGVSYLPNAVTVPSAGPSGGGGFLYASNGALYWIGPSNTATRIAPA